MNHYQELSQPPTDNNSADSNSGDAVDVKAIATDSKAMDSSNIIDGRTPIRPRVYFPKTGPVTYEEIESHLKRLQGETLTVIDGAGLPPVQTKGIKDIINRAFSHRMTLVWRRFHPESLMDEGE